MFDTIAAIASGNINQAISIIRMSGNDAFDIIKKIFNGKIGSDKTISYGFIVNDKKEKIDEVLVSFFKGNSNFVGEDTIEIMCHGGIIVTNQVLELLIVNGARRAENGEFSRRAFLNGKIDIIKAEAINDLIHAKTIMQTKIAMKKFNNNTSDLIKSLIQEVEMLIGICEVNIDYPEYNDVEKMDEIKMEKIMLEFLAKMDEIIKIGEQNQLYSNPIKIAIVGKPNSGKSALLNALLNEEKSIVTNIKGTTRDIVEGELVFNNIILKFSDTAGIRKSNDKIEKIGIKKSLKEIENSQLIFHLIDGTKKENEDDILIEKKSQGKFYFKIFNKKDLIPSEKIKQGNIYISAKNKDLISLKEHLETFFQKEVNLNSDKEWFFNQRELSLLKKASLAVQNALNSKKKSYGFEVLIVDIYEAWEALRNIVGVADKEDLLDSIFKNFCLGK
ncbi:MAG: tRNA uridine-5-carboxymethylaminomethyl(34) synthesis GTPase MnmE [Metamycoplasmataceae bacterium]